jgi:hypothetical protein
MSFEGHNQFKEHPRLFSPLEEDKDYWINNYVHRSSPVRFKAPALVRHVGYWYNDESSVPPPEATHPIIGRDQLNNLRTREYLDKVIIEFSGTLREKLRQNGTANADQHVIVTPNVEDTILLFADCWTTDFSKKRTTLRSRQRDIFFADFRTVTIQFPWHDLAVVTVRFELFTEHFSAFTCVDLHERVSSDVSKRFSLDVDATLQNLIDRIMLAIGDDKKNGGLSNLNKTEMPKQFFYDTFWESFARDLLASKRIVEIRGHELMRRIFADFRGLILSDELVQFPYTNFEKPSWGAAAANKLLPLVSEGNRWECTASYMLDGHALHMSALGPQAPEISDDQRAPVTYVLYVHQRTISALFSPKRVVSRWQLGLLIDRIHLVETARLAALRDLKTLHGAGESLAELEQLLKKARQAAEDQTEVRESQGDEHIPDRDKASETDTKRDEDTYSLRVIHNAQRHFNSIGRRYFEKTKSPTGLMHRVERSRFYAALFRANIPALRLARLEGYQRYDQFVDRRLGSSYDFIDRLGNRYERASNALQTVYLENLTNRSYKTGEEIERLQRFAEAALVGVLIPYYIVSSMSHIAASASHSDHATHAGPTVAQALSVVFLSILPGVAIYRFQAKTKTIPRRLRNAGFMVLLAAIYWVVIYADHSVTDWISHKWGEILTLLTAWTSRA